MGVFGRLRLLCSGGGGVFSMVIGWFLRRYRGREGDGGLRAKHSCQKGFSSFSFLVLFIDDNLEMTGQGRGNDLPTTGAPSPSTNPSLHEIAQ